MRVLLLQMPSRQQWLSLAPLLLLLGMTGGLAMGALMFIQAPAQERLARAQGAYEQAKKTQARQQVMWKTDTALKTRMQALPMRTEFTNLILVVTDLARRETVVLPGITYALQKTEEGVALKATLSFQATGDYARIRRFIHELETSGPHLFVESLDVSSSPGKAKARSSSVSVNIRLGTFLRPETSPSEI